MEQYTWLLLSAVTFIVSTAATAELAPAERLEELSNKIAVQNNLDYGAPCSASPERTRITITKQFLNYLLSLDPSNDQSVNEIQEKMLGFLTRLAEIPGNLCNSFKSMECDLMANTCGCISSGKDTFGFDAIFIRDEDNKVCRLAPGSTCFPEELHASPPMSGVPKQELFCSKNSNCIVKSNGKDCNKENAIQEIQNALQGEQLEKLQLFRLIMKKLNDGLCVCDGSPAIAAKSPNSDMEKDGFLYKTPAENGQKTISGSNNNIITLVSFSMLCYFLNV